MKCPICGSESCDKFVIDTYICNTCSHIFKEEPVNNNTTIQSLHLLKHPVEEVQEFLDDGPKKEYVVFVLPTMNFYGLEVRPTDFYKPKINHYFNQKSMMILLKRAELKPIAQYNYWNGAVCRTLLICQDIRGVDE